MAMYWQPVKIYFPDVLLSSLRTNYFDIIKTKGWQALVLPAKYTHSCEDQQQITSVTQQLFKCFSEATMTDIQTDSQSRDLQSSFTTPH